MGEAATLSRIRELRQYYEHSVSPSRDTVFQSLAFVYSENLVYLRGILLLALYENADPSFLGVPSVPELYQSIYAENQKALLEYPPMFVQMLGVTVGRVHANPKRFAEVMIEFLRGKTNDQLVFAFCTFPAMYAYFAFEEMKNMACEFMAHFFEISKSFTSSSWLLCAFFRTQTQFYDALWYKFGAVIRKVNPDMKFETIYEMADKAMKQACNNLCESISTAIRSFCEAFSSEFSPFFVKKLILEPFLAATDGSPYLTQPSKNKIFANFLFELCEPDNHVFAVGLVSSFVSHGGLAEFSPKMNVPVWKSKGIKLLFSHRDISMIVSALFEAPDFVIKWNYHDVPLKNSFGAVTMEIFPPSVEKTKMNYGEISIELFGIEPIEFEPVSEDDPKTRLWRRMAQEKEDQIIQYVWSRLDTYEDEFRLFAENMILKQFESHYEDIEDVVLCSFVLQTLNDQLESAKASINTYFAKFSYGFLHKKIRASHRSMIVQKIDDAINAVIGSTNPRDRSIFEIGCTGLDSIVLLPGPKTKELQERFRDLLSTWVDNEWRVQHQYVKRRFRIMSKIGAPLVELGQVKLGRRLKIIIDFQKNLQTIFHDVWDELWKTIFHFAILSASPDLLITFLFLEHYVFQDRFIVGRWAKEDIHSYWMMFSGGILQVIKADQALTDYCVNPDKRKEYLRIELT